MNQIENQLKTLSNMSSFVSKIPFFEEEFKSTIFSHPDKPPLNINIIRRRYIKRNHFVPDVEWIKSDYFSPQNYAKRNYFQQFPPQVRNTLRKQYEKYIQQVRITILFFICFFKFMKLLKRIATLTSRKTIEKFSHNKKLLNQQNINQEESREKSREKFILPWERWRKQQR